ncbi:MAG: hypothetical protein ACXWTS_10870, partial [Methylococcaceae bacterium]
MNKKSLLSIPNLFTVLLILSLIGVAISDISPTQSHLYWIVMVIMFGVTSIIANYNRAENIDKTQLKKDIFIQILHWLGGLVAVLIVYAFYHTGRITPEETGLVVLLILALTTYLDGIRISWRFGFVGLYLGIIAICAAYI